MCGIIASGLHPPLHIESTDKEVLWRDDNFTAYREKAHPVSSRGHIIIALKCVSSSPDVVENAYDLYSLHVDSIYKLVCCLHI
jgi:hypothetical protein